MRLVYAVFAWCAGILLAAQLKTHLPTPWLVLVCALAAAFALTWHRRTLRGVLLLLLLFALGGLRFAMTPASTPVAAYNGYGGLTVEGVIVSAPTPRNTGLQFVLSAETVTRAGQTHPTSGLVLVDTPLGYPAKYGERVRATGELFRPPTFDTFSYADFLARSSVFSLLPAAAVEVVAPENAGAPLMRVLVDVREAASANINRSLPEPYAGLMRGILLGDESGISPDIEDAFARTGAAHVVAISGYNMVVISGVLLALLGRTPFSRSTQAWIVLIIIALYSVFVGASASVVRAAVMSGVLIVGERLIRRKTFVPATLAFVTIVMSLQNPYVLWDVGFQLSLFATLGIVLFARPMTQWVRRRLELVTDAGRAENITGLLESGLLVSLAAQVLTLPLIALYFERFSLISLPVNVLIAPVQPFILLLGGLAALVAFVSPILALPIFSAVLVPLGWTTGVVRAASALPFAEVVVRLDAEPIAALFFIVIGGAVLQATQPDWLLHAVRFVRQRPVFTGTAAVASAVLVLLVAVIASRPDGKLHLWALNMGHSHALLLQTPSGSQVLIDGGRFPSRLLLALGDRLPFTDRTLEMVVITQPDEFDYGALPEVFTRYSPGIVVTNGPFAPSRAAVTVQQSMGEALHTTVTQGYQIELDANVTLEVLHPDRAAPPTQRLNDNSMVLRLVYGDTSVMIPADASQVAQESIIALGRDVTSDVMIMPQHATTGSLDADFLAAVNPSMLVLQVDPANRIGDPNEDTLAMVEGVPLYRTDVGGTIHLILDGSQVVARYEG